LKFAPYNEGFGFSKNTHFLSQLKKKKALISGMDPPRVSQLRCAPSAGCHSPRQRTTKAV
jgi:hypothetical protein